MLHELLELHDCQLIARNANGFEKLVLGPAKCDSPIPTPETVVPLATVLSLAEITPESSRLA